MAPLDSSLPFCKGQLAIIGTGAFAQGLAALALRSGAFYSQQVLIGSRRQPDGADPGSLPGLDGADVVSIGDALAGAGIVVLALPAWAHAQFAKEHGPSLAGKVVVDVCNPPAGESMWAEGFLPSDSDLEKAGGKASAEGSDASDASPRAPAAAGAGAASHAEGLAAALGAHCAVVKGLNNIGARAMLDAAKPAGARLSTTLASDSAPALAVVAGFLFQLGIDSRTVPCLRYARQMEEAQNVCMTSWRWPTLLTVLVLLVCTAYMGVRYGLGSKWPWYDLFFVGVNKVLAWASLVMLALTFLPGMLARLLQYAQRRSLSGPSRLPDWLGAWLDARKQIGLWAVLLVAMHTVVSCIAFLPVNYAKFFQKGNALALATTAGTSLTVFGVPNTLPALPGNYTLLSNATAPGALADAVAGAAAAAAGSIPQAMAVKAKILTLGSRLTWSGELCLLLGVLAAAALIPTTLTSLKAVGDGMSWREWRLLQSYFGNVALLLSLAHVMMLGIPNNGWTDTSLWAFGMPAISVMSSILPMAVVGGWALLAVLRLLRALTLRCAPGLWRAPGGSGGLETVPRFSGY